MACEEDEEEEDVCGDALGRVLESWLRITERMAWVPQAFWIVWAAKNGESPSLLVSYWPSCGDLVEGLSLLLLPVGRRYLKRKITP